MNIISTTLLAITRMIAIIVSVVLITQASINIVVNDDSTRLAYRYLAIGTNLGWLSVIFMMVGVGFVFIFGTDALLGSSRDSQVLTNVVLVLMTLIFLANGVVAGLAAVYLRQSEVNKTYYDYAVAASFICLSSAIVMIFTLIFKVISDRRKRRKSR